MAGRTSNSPKNTPAATPKKAASAARAPRSAPKKATSAKQPPPAKTKAQRAAERAARETELRLKRQQALDLRAAGATYEQIAQQVGYANKSGAWKAVEALLAEARQEKADQVMELELYRLDQMQVGLWSRARRGDTPAVDRVLKIMDRRAKYLHLDNPQVTDAIVEGTNLLAGLAAQLVQMPDTYEGPQE